MIKFRYLLFLFIFPTLVIAKEPTYKTSHFKNGDEFSVLVRCLYLGEHLLGIKDAQELFENSIIHLKMSQQYKFKLKNDAMIWWDYFLTQYEVTEKQLSNLYWENNCETQANNMRKFLNGEGNITATQAGHKQLVVLVPRYYNQLFLAH